MFKVDPSGIEYYGVTAKGVGLQHADTGSYFKSDLQWKRVSILGQAMKYSDIELEDPINKEMYQVQVKSKATLQDFQTYSGKFASDKYRKLFFVVHTPDSKLAEVVPDSASPIQLVLPNRLAEMVIEQGILGWLMDKIR